MRVLCRALAIVAVASCSAAVFAQGRGGQNWNTTNADAQRTGWIRTETRISVASVQQTGPNGFQLLWKVKPEMPGSQQPGPLTQPVILQNLISHKGFKALLFVGRDDAVWAYDYDLAKPVLVQPARCEIFAARHGGVSRGLDVADPGHAARAIGDPGCHAFGASRGRGFGPGARRGPWPSVRHQPEQSPDRECRLGRIQRGHAARAQPARRRGSQAAAEIGASGREGDRQCSRR